MAALDSAEGAEPSAAAMTKFSQCLNLERPESYSVVGRAHDASVHVTKFPQPMIYSPAGGLVIYEPPVTTAVEQMEWLEKLSSPKAVRAKSPVAGRKSPQHLWRPPSPSNNSSPHHSHEREFSLRGNQQERTTASAQRTLSQLHTGRQQSPTAAAAAQHEQRHWGSKLLDAQLGGGYIGERVASPGTRSGSSGAPPGTAMRELAAARATANAAGVGLLRQTGHTEGPASANTAPAGKAPVGQAGSGRAGRLGGSLHKPGDGEQEAVVASDRITLTQPYVFRWGGRINSKHRPLCEMHSTAGPDSANRGSSRPKKVVNDSSQTAGNSQHSEVSKLPQKQQAAAQEQAAAAAALGARADKLMKLLELRVPRQHGNSGKRRPVSGRMQRLQHEAADGDELVYELEDDPIGCSDEYLRL